jgi:type III secretion system TyeA family effector delivery regulator
MNQDPLENEALRLTVEMLNLVLEPFVDANQIKELVNSLKLQTLGAKMFFLTTLSVTVRKYPMDIFPSAESKQNLLAAVQSVLDELILEENDENDE